MMGLTKAVVAVPDEVPYGVHRCEGNSFLKQAREDECQCSGLTELCKDFLVPPSQSVAVIGMAGELIVYRDQFKRRVLKHCQKLALELLEVAAGQLFEMLFLEVFNHNKVNHPTATPQIQVLGHLGVLLRQAIRVMNSPIHEFDFNC